MVFLCEMRRRLAYWSIPSLLCLVVYWPGLVAWFQQDDFAWLALRLSVHSAGDLLRVLFVPMAQGTIRPLSERAFFLVFQAVFGFEAGPYRVWVFLTQFASLVLLSAIARRVTGSRLAGFLAPVFWVLNTGLVVPMSWTSAYNQILCAFFMLLAFYCRLRRIETHKGRWLAAEWAAFAAGLGSLEVAIVYPALAAAYSLFWARKHFRSTLPLFAASAVYGLAHFSAVPHGGSPAYALHFGWSMAGTLWTYWQRALGAAGVREHVGRLPEWPVVVAASVLTAGILGGALWSGRRRALAGAFGLLWFVVTLAPVVPLRDHVTSYYLTIPAAGLALALASGVAAAWKGSPGWGFVALALAALYAVPGAIECRRGSLAVAERSWRIRTVALGVQRARQMYPQKTIVLAGVDKTLFWTGFADKPFRALGISGIYLAPGSEQTIGAHAAQMTLAQYVIPAEVLRTELEANRAVVYAVEPHRLRGATIAYRIKAREEWQADQEPSSVDAGNPLFAQQLGPTWWPIAGGSRWMPKTATVRLRGPRSADEWLVVFGRCIPQQVRTGPLRLRVGIDGVPGTEVVELRNAGEFRTSLRLPPASVGAPAIVVRLEVDRTFRIPPDKRELGLLFGSFEVGR